MPIKPSPQLFPQSSDGAVAVIIALCLVFLFGFMALGIDLGSLYFRQKALQTHADMASVSAVLNLNDAPHDKAQATVIGNGLPASALTALAYGRYDYDPDAAVLDRFQDRTSTDSDVNAVDVTLESTAPLYFSRTFIDADHTSLSARATAARFNFASFSLGSRLLSLNGGLLNALLGDALGSALALSALDYQALADTQIDLLTFTDALATRADLTALNYADILTSDIDLTDVAGALLDTGLVTGSTDALTAILNSTASSTLNAAQLIAIDGGGVGLDLEDILGDVSVSALDILLASVDILNANHVIDASLDLGVPNVLSTDLALIVGAREAHSGWITLGEKSATLRTAQVRFKLSLTVAPSLLSGLGTGVSVLAIRLPLYAEIASAMVTLTDLNCSAALPNDVLARFDTGFEPLSGGNGTHVVELFIGEFDTPDFEDTTTPLSLAELAPADFLDVSLNVLLVTLPLFTFQLKSHAVTGVPVQSQTDFLLSELGTTQTYGSGSLLGSTVVSLLDPETTEISANKGLLGALLGPLVDTALSLLPVKLLSALLTPIDAILDAVLNLLGIGVGEADLTLHAVSCGKVALVR